MQNLEIPELRFPLTVVAHDAGAANHICAWVKPYFKKEDIRFVLEGPAVQIFSSQLPSFKNSILPESLTGSALLLSGTSGQATYLEHDARKSARAAHVPSIGVLDHWIHYRERFVRQGQEVLPDTLWVSDEFALQKACEEFPDLPVQCKPNHYLDALVREIRAFSRSSDKKLHLLYVLEPIRASWGNSTVSGEFQALDYFFGKLPLLIPEQEIEIRLRPHPSESASKYAEWVATHQQRAVYLDLESSLQQAIGWSDWVLGCESYALYVSSQAGKRVISTFPPWAPQWRLPWPIQQLRFLI